MGPADAVFFNPQHPYTQLLVGSNPEPDPVGERSRPSTQITGEIPSPVNIPPGCRFANRCPKVMDVCRVERPALLPLRDVSDGERRVACHLFN
jgi:oligopeptide/dipeptide ABC transporter ATP-binding protein